MSERYNPKKLIRQATTERWHALVAPNEAAREAQRKLDEVSQKLRGAPVVVLCNHNVPWLRCTLCSKPRTT